MPLSSDLINNFFDAINVISKDNVEQSHRDITIDAEIVQLINADRGEYKVSYQGNTFSAESTDVTVTYNPGDKVYVFVPQGDYTKKKLILGRSDYKNNDSYEDRQDMTNFYVDRGPNWLEWYGFDHMPLQICAVSDQQKGDLKETPKAEEGKDLASRAYFTDYGFMRRLPDIRYPYNRYPIIDKTELEFSQFLAEADDQLVRYGKAWEDIKISATFKTNFASVHTTGQYALRVTCVADNPKYITDPSHPDYKKFHGEEFIKIMEEKDKYVSEIDKVKYDSDEDYRKEVDAKILEYNALAEQASEQKRYQLLTFDLGFKSFSGSPYAFVTETPQKGYFHVGKNLLKGLYSIELMQDGSFVADIIPTYHDDGTITYDLQNAVLDRNNIFCDNIDIRFCEKINLSDTLYFPWIETPYGNALYFRNEKMGRPTGRTRVTLIAHLQHGNKDILNEDSCEVYWFREKSDVTSATFTEDEKDEHGFTPFDYSGPGWYPVDRLIEVVEEVGGEQRRNYDIKFNELSIDISAVPYKWNYKAVIVYRDKNTAEKSIITMVQVEQLVERIDSPYDLDIETVVQNGGRDTMLRILNKNKSVYENDPTTGQPWPEWYGTWWLKLQDESYTRISDPYHRGLLKVNDFLLNDVAIFYVQAYDPEQVDPSNTGKAYMQRPEITTLSKLIVAAQDGDLHINWVGKDQFNYDALGTLKGWEADVDNTLIPEVSWAEGHASDYIITIFGPDGIPLSNLEYYDTQNKDEAGKASDPPNSMLKNIWVDFENTIHFKVEEQYVDDKAFPENNTFTLKLSCLNGQNFELKKTIFFSKDGAMGTQGSDWVATIRPCNWKYGPDREEGAFIEAINYPNPIIVNCDEDADTMEQDKNFRLFLRPFVSKNGIPLEQLDPFEGYFYKVYWDVRMPGSILDAEKKEDQIRKYASFLRLYHANGKMASGDLDVGPVYKRTGTFYENGGMHTEESYKVDFQNSESHATDGLESKISPNETEESKNGLIGFSVYPSRQYGLKVPELLTENYGAIEVRFFDNKNKGTTATIEELLYRFIVKAQVDIMKGQYDQKTKMIQVEGNVERIASITSYYPVDLIFNYDGLNFLDSKNHPDIFEPYKKIATNWPRYISYNASGYDPSCFDTKLDFKFSDKGLAGDTTIHAWNLTPLTQTLETSFDKETGEIIQQRYRPKPHLNMTEGFHGVLRTYPETEVFGPGSGKTFFLRNQVMFLNAYGNVDINGWDGQGIDMNEEKGTIFATTVGAGYKRPSTNAFTGVLMGADSALPRANVKGYNMAYDAEAVKRMPYLTGLFGFQDGIKSFALLENGTGFFGRADRGARIIFDGANAMIYGGCNGVIEKPSIKDDMWNCMRLNLVDLTHATYKEGENVGGMYPNVQDNEGDKITSENPPSEDFQSGDEQKTRQIMPAGSSVDNVDLRGDGAFFGYQDDASNGTYQYKLPKWYKMLWQRAYIKPYGAQPYWLDAIQNGDGIHIAELSYDKLPPYKKGQKISGGQNYRINYFDKVVTKNVTAPDSPDTETDLPDSVWEDKTWDDQTKSKPLTGFGPSRASTTPAIEIGQHITGLMPGLLPWCAYEEIFKTLQIPGDRNFMVTYDGTLWAMNGVFMGAVIGSNIIGGRIQGAEIGIGQSKVNEDETTYVMLDHGSPVACGSDCPSPGALQNIECDVRLLHAPWDMERDVWENGTPGGDDEDSEDYICKGSGGLGFYVDPNGNVVANSIKIYGGSIDMGRFHILGGRKNRDDYGHLIQIAESDFIGPTHFYGNISITPLANMREFKRKNGNSSLILGDKKQGNLFQGAGIVALGIPIWTSPDPENMDVSESWKRMVKDKGLTGSRTYYSTTSTTNNPHIGEGNSIQQNAFFAIDHLKGALPQEGDDETRFKGHFWPLYYHYGYTAEEITDVDGNKVIPAYVTTMNIFKQKSFKLYQGQRAPSIDASNYFRIGPFGGETMSLWIRKSFQDEKTCTVPDAEKYNGSDKDIYLAKFGVNQRDGTTTGSSDQASVGLDTYYTAPIIVNSDGESAWTSRGHFHFWIRGMGGNARTPMKTWDGNLGGPERKFGVVMNFGSNINTPDSNSSNKGYIKTAHSALSFGVKANGETSFDQSVDMFEMPLPGAVKFGGGLLIDPYGNGPGGTDNAKAKGTYLWARDSDIHICRFKANSADHDQGKDHNELWMSEEALRGTATKAISMLVNYPAHKEMATGETCGFGVDLNNAMLVHNKSTIISAKSSSYTGDNMQFLSDRVTFNGIYAIPDNQYHIYARFG